MDLGNFWALALNTTRARILRGIVLREAVPPELVMRAEHRRLQRLVAAAADLPAALREDPLEADRREFLAQVVQVLEAHRLAGDFAALAVFAAPDLLGELRAAMPSRLAATVVASVPRALVDLPEDALSRAVLAEMTERKLAAIPKRGT